MRSVYLTEEQTRRVLRRLTPANRLACELAAATGLRIGDVMRLTREALEAARKRRGWLTVVEQKTKRKRTVRVPSPLLVKAIAFAGKIYLFPNQRDPTRHRDRTTVWKQLARVQGKTRPRCTPHTFRKQYAVRRYKASGSLERVRSDLGHQNVSTTMLYALSDVMQDAHDERKRNHRRNPHGKL